MLSRAPCRFTKGRVQSQTCINSSSQRGIVYCAQDSHLHYAGDRILSSLAQLLLRRLDQTEHLFSLAGDANRPVETGRNITTYHLDQGSLDAVAWSPNGKRIAVNSFSEGHRLPFLDALFAVGSDTGGSETLFILNASDGRQLAKYDNRPGLYLSHFVLLLQIAFDRGS